MNILVTLKPLHYRSYGHNYGILSEINWKEKKIIRTLKIPSTAIDGGEEFFIPSVISGICNIKSRIFVSTWNFIVEIDYKTFEVVNAFSHPHMADLHGMTTDGQYIWAASTAIDSVLCFDVANFNYKWRWGPDSPILWQDRMFSGRLKSYVKKFPALRNWFRLKFEDNDYRIIHKKISPYHYHHLNDVCFHKDTLYITTKGWNRDSYGAVVQLNLKSFDSSFYIQPGVLKSTHDGLFKKGNFYLTQCDTNSVAWKDVKGEVSFQKLEPSPYFIRGLCPINEMFLIGFTKTRDADFHSQIIEFDKTFERRISCFDVDNFYPRHIGTAVHAIIRSPYAGE